MKHFQKKMQIKKTIYLFQNLCTPCIIKIKFVQLINQKVNEYFQYYFNNFFQTVKFEKNLHKYSNQSEYCPFKTSEVYKVFVNKRFNI